MLTSAPSSSRWSANSRPEPPAAGRAGAWHGRLRGLPSPHQCDELRADPRRRRAPDYDEADLILVGGVARGQDPTCIYLALHHGVKAANHPLTPEDLGTSACRPSCASTGRSCSGSPSTHCGCSRSARTPANSRYAQLDTCRREVAQAEAMLRRKASRCSAPPTPRSRKFPPRARAPGDQPRDVLSSARGGLSQQPAWVRRWPCRPAAAACRIGP